MDRPEFQSLLSSMIAKSGNIDNVKDKFDRRLTLAGGLACRMQQKMRAARYWNKFDDPVCLRATHRKTEMRFVYRISRVTVGPVI